MNNLRRLDLNLLLTLDALLIEHNVTRAARRLNLTQSSVSVQLAKLRRVFDDPLLLPGPRGMWPTAHADALREPLREALQALEAVVAPAANFDPAKARHALRLAASDYTASTLLLPLFPALRAAAPLASLAVLGLDPARIARQAEQREIDLAFHTRHDAPASLRQRVLYKERYVLAGRVGHPRLRRKPTLAQFCKLDHALVSPDGGGFRGVTDQALAALGLQRNVVASVPHFLLLCAMLATTDLVAMLPERLARTAPGLRVVEPPIEVPGFEIAMLWHERSHRDPAHVWLREFIAASV
ncbi:MULTISPECIES: LysR family transcriptional regulator [Hydrocarboniphaga]|uniref:Transcriptional regulator, LysR family n=1 Tax=Hydrocarboniphaga effusa AP103 TaxID=1172194 RepID=I7ZCD0_9GAMM|nr:MULTISPECIES: LysR family transcriptional regulator [Hydrocarboniphaga]EIT69504.1 transcriptional regulator, LysR family [Hydrocarboniphaga effusa AP103]MDZ4080824.1 LysR family transcriptional regulator [Hydrocarboniphaga sp.]MDZ4080865.1 LysR family transcriptional regulator [Hydrocarboniphaga sp.]